MEQGIPKPLPLEYRPSVDLPGDAPKDECYRCGYELRGIANDHPCPECGLLAERSRRLTDELHNTRPRWLRNISWGVNLILFAIVLVVAWYLMFPSLASYFGYPIQRWNQSIMFIGPQTFASMAAMIRLQQWYHWIEIAGWLGYGVAAIAFWIGVILLTRREHYPPADRADRRLRTVLRILAFVPFAVVTVWFLQQTNLLPFPPLYIGLPIIYGVLFSPLHFGSPKSYVMIWVYILFSIGSIPLPALLFFHLRGLAKRVRSAHLAEHCAIVGIGASMSVLFVIAASMSLANRDVLWLDDNWENRSKVALALLVPLRVFACLFLLWSLYLLIRFAISFRRATRHLNLKWRNDDHSAPHQ